MNVFQALKESSDLASYRKLSGPKTLLFEQGFPAHSLFVLLEGSVELLAKKNGVYTPVHYLGAGNLLGEQLLVDHQLGPRVFGARTLTELRYIELTRNEIQKISQENLQLYTDLLSVALRISNLRIHRMNRLLLNMRSLNLTERFLNLLLYFSAHHGQITPEGKLVVLHFDTISFYIGINSHQFESLLEDLIGHGVIAKKKEGVYLIKNEKALQDQVPKLAQEIATLNFI